MAPIYPSTPGCYHVPYQRSGDPWVGWHGETYCLVGGYRSYGDAPLATPAKAEAEKPVPRQALKRCHPGEKCDAIWRLELNGKRMKAQTLIPAKAGAEKSVPRRAPKRRHPGDSSDRDLGCSSPKIRRLELVDNGLTVQNLAPTKTGVEKPVLRRAPKRRHPGDSCDKDLGCSGPKIRRLELEDNSLTPLNLTPANVGEENPVPRRALKRHHSGENSDQVLGCPSPKIQRLEQDGETLMPQNLTPAKTYAEKPLCGGTLKRLSSWLKF